MTASASRMTFSLAAMSGIQGHTFPANHRIPQSLDADATGKTQTGSHPLRAHVNPLLLYRRAIHGIDHHGFRGAVRQAFRIVSGPSGTGVVREDSVPHPFDQAHQVDTSGLVRGEDINSGSLSDLYITGYYGISPSSLEQALKLLPEPVDAYTFVDLGCGKGRALLVAAELGFRRLVGVEIAPELARIAQANTAQVPRVQVEQGDAATFAFPPEPLVIFLYHPFLPPVLKKVLRNLQRERAGSAHPTFLLYANPAYQRVIARFPFLKLVWHHRLALSPEDAAVDWHGIVDEPYALYRTL